MSSPHAAGDPVWVTSVVGRERVTGRDIVKRKDGRVVRVEGKTVQIRFDGESTPRRFWAKDVHAAGTGGAPEQLKAHPTDKPMPRLVAVPVERPSVPGDVDQVAVDLMSWMEMGADLRSGVERIVEVEAAELAAIDAELRLLEEMAEEKRKSLNAHKKNLAALNDLASKVGGKP